MNCKTAKQQYKLAYSRLRRNDGSISRVEDELLTSIYTDNALSNAYKSYKSSRVTSRAVRGITEGFHKP